MLRKLVIPAVRLHKDEHKATVLHFVAFSDSSGFLHINNFLEKPKRNSIFLPKHLDQSRDSTRLEDWKKPFAVVGQVVQGASRAASCLHITGVLHGTDNSRNHLRGAHQGVTRRLLLWQLVHHHSCLIHNNLGQRHSWLQTQMGCTPHCY